MAQRKLCAHAHEWQAGVRIGNEGIPEGKVISAISGGPESLERLTEKLKKYEFTGYIMTKMKHADSMCHGFLVIRNGSMVGAVYGRLADGRFAATKAGEEGLKLIWGDSYDKDCSIEVHSRLDIDLLLGMFPGSILGKPPERKALKRRTRFSLEWGDNGNGQPGGDVDLPPELKAKLDQWTAAGFITKTLLDEVKGDPKGAAHAFERFGENIRKVEFLRKEIDEVDRTRYGDDIERIKALLRNPSKITNIEANMQGLRVKIERDRPRVEVPAPIAEPSKPAEVAEEPRLEGQGDIFPREQTPADVCQVCGAELRGRADCPSCGAQGGESGPRPMGEQGLIPAFTFDSFVVGKSNSFSHAAAVAASKPGSSYNNPIIICGPAGLGKTHLLNAIGNFVAANMPETRILCTTAERWAADYEEAARSDGLAQFRKRHQGLDFLLVDDIHALSPKPDAVRDEFMRIADSLNGKKRQLVFTCERPLNQTDRFEEALAARFPANLVTALDRPDLQTRHEILRRKAAVRKPPVPDNVLEFIARRYTKSVRALENALNKVAAFSKLMSVPISLETAREALKGDPVEQIDEPEPATAAGAISSIETKIDTLKMSHSYLIEEERPVKCFEYFVDNLNLGMRGMALTRVNPKRVREQYDVGDSAVLWLTDREGDPESQVPPVLERIIYKIEDFLNTPGKSILLIDGLDYLVSNNNFDSVLRFLRRLIDEVSESEAILITSITPETLDEQGLKILEREMEIISFFDRE